jgi:hypothetical protein
MFHTPKSSASLLAFIVLSGAQLAAAVPKNEHPGEKPHEGRQPPSTRSQTEDHDDDDTRAASKESKRQCPKCPDKRLITLALAGGGGGVYVKGLGWLQGDGALKHYIGVRLHRMVDVQIRYMTSVERFAQAIGFGAVYYPLPKRPFGTVYLRLALDLLMAGAGVQPSLAGAVGYAYWSPVPVGVFAELEASTTLNAPETFTLNGWGGLFVYF